MEWCPWFPSRSSCLAAAMQFWTVVHHWFWQNRNKLHKLERSLSLWKMSPGSSYLDPEVNMAVLSILIARPARSLMYSWLTWTSGRPLKRLPSPPSRMTYSASSWADQLPTRSKNQLTAAGLEMFSFTQISPFHGLTEGICGERPADSRPSSNGCN